MTYFLFRSKKQKNSPKVVRQIFYINKNKINFLIKSLLNFSNLTIKIENNKYLKI